MERPMEGMGQQPMGAEPGMGRESAPSPRKPARRRAGGKAKRKAKGRGSTKSRSKSRGGKKRAKARGGSKRRRARRR